MSKWNPFAWIMNKLAERKRKKEEAKKQAEAERKYKEKMEEKLKRLKEQDPYIYD